MIKSVIAAAEYSEIESFSGIDHSAYQETSAITNDFNHLSKYYVNFISTDLSAQNAMMSAQNDGQNSGRYSHGFRSWIKFEIFVPTRM